MGPGYYWEKTVNFCTISQVIMESLQYLCVMKSTIIHNKIYELRGQKVMLDFDLAELYDVETRVLNQAVKRNIGRFPKDFMFQLSREEWRNLISQVVMSSWGGSRKLPFAFTEHGVTMLASVLHSARAIRMNIAIVRAFIALRIFANQYKELAAQIQEIRQTTRSHNEQLEQIYDALENLLDEKAAQKKWEDREPIGFKTNTKKK